MKRFLLFLFHGFMLLSNNLDSNIEERVDKGGGAAH